uniref:Uncharacterized protein n=1 Tax=Skeletonema marinoi TaxID=267567 RepID=A0A7S2LYD2_9STRA|mmetsp:Transcript_32192/g.54400  ORF Transcript_32192/g.54400 Transcript_32192/m.54400 type:complete len:139 (+) Transcript_32192:43-459(+)
MLSTPKRPNQGVTSLPECPPPPTRAKPILIVPRTLPPSLPHFPRKTSPMASTSFFSETYEQQGSNTESGSTAELDGFFLASPTPPRFRSISRVANAQASNTTNTKFKLKPRLSFRSSQTLGGHHDYHHFPPKIVQPES